MLRDADKPKEYPGADDRGGQPSDTQNYVTLLQELKAALGSKGLTATLPTSYWYLRHFDLKSAQKSVDWCVHVSLVDAFWPELTRVRFNLMAYDLHGTWDASSQFVGPYIAPHTNLTEIDLGLDLLWRAGVDANKVVLGEGWVRTLG
jgi:chitinase